MIKMPKIHVSLKLTAALPRLITKKHDTLIKTLEKLGYKV